MNVANTSGEKIMPKSKTWRIEKDESGDRLLIIPDEYSDEFAVDDVVEFFNTRKGDYAFKNLSCFTVPASRLRRDLNTLQRKLTSDTNPLKRVVVTLNEEKIAIVKSSEDLKLAAVVCERKGQPEIKVKLEDL